ESTRKKGSTALQCYDSHEASETTDTPNSSASRADTTAQLLLEEQTPST
ncbi:hypothetical protein L916_05779, partial [Phytophthora nicotianae]